MARLTVHGLVLLFSSIASCRAAAWYPCWTLNYQWTGSTPLPTPVNSPADCAKLCNQTLGGSCAHFSWFGNQCTLGQVTDKLVYSANHVSGPPWADCTCPSVGPVLGAFPSQTDAGAMRAWRNGRQPTPLSCWPSSTKLEACLKAPLAIFDSAQNTWGGDCEAGLQTVQATDESHCRQLCTDDPTCASWQFRTDGSCRHGWGERCQKKSPNIQRAQRLIHGRVRLLKSMTQYQVTGLKKVFDQSYYPDLASATKDCQYTCYSNVYCQVWQYISDQGCFVEDPQNSMASPYPLSVESTLLVANGNIVAGEYIQHYCGKARNAQPASALVFKQHVASPPLPMGKAVSAASGSLVGVILLCCSGVVVTAFWIRHKPPKRPKPYKSMKSMNSGLNLAVWSAPPPAQAVPLTTFQPATSFSAQPVSTSFSAPTRPMYAQYPSFSGYPVSPRARPSPRPS